MLLNELFKNAPAVNIEMISSDTRMPMRNALFFAIKGIRYNGHDFIEKAYKEGAVAVVYDEDIQADLPLIYIKVENTIDSLNLIAPLFYNHPGKKLENIVVGGCFARSLIAFGIKKCIDHFRKAGYIGTLGIQYDDKYFYSRTTNLVPIETQHTLSNMVESGILTCSFELDCQTINYKKLGSIDPDCFIFSGIDEEENEYQTYQNNYIDLYSNYLNDLKDNCDVILNTDSLYFNELLNSCNYNIVTFGESDDCDYRIVNKINNNYETEFQIQCSGSLYNIKSNLFGSYVIPVLTAIFTTLCVRGYPADEVADVVNNFKFPAGIMEVIDVGQKFNIINDKVTSLTSLKDILKIAGETTDTAHRIIAVYGISLKNDRHFRELAANLLDNKLDELILTENDAGDKNQKLLNTNFGELFKNTKIIYVENREEAIDLAVELMNANDFLLLLGKGSEQYLLRPLGREFYIGDSEAVKRAIRYRLETTFSD